MLSSHPITWVAPKAQAQAQEEIVKEIFENSIAEAISSTLNSASKQISFPPLPQTPNHKPRIQSDPLRFLSRRQSSPSHLLIKDADLLLKVQQTLPSVNSSPIKLENRRKLAPLTPAGHDRPKFIGHCNQIIKKEKESKEAKKKKFAGLHRLEI